MSTRVYRTLLLLYPRSFRRAYGEDMVAVFEELRRDRAPAAFWWRVGSDAFKSITVQRLETTMSKESTSRSLLFAALVAVTVVVILGSTGVNSFATFALTVAVAGGAVVAAIVYWRSTRAYVEPSDEVHRYWWRVLAIGAGLIALVNIGSAFDVEAPWLLLFTGIIAGAMLIMAGVILGLWHALVRIRPASA